MPIYDLKCNQCSREFEYFQLKIDDKPSCPHCSSQDSEKLPPKKTSFQLKGGGWYNGGYSSTKGKK